MCVTGVRRLRGPSHSGRARLRKPTSLGRSPRCLAWAWVGCCDFVSVFQDRVMATGTHI